MNDLSNYVGHVSEIGQLKDWLNVIIANPQTPRRLCFLTGPVGSGKSTLARLVLRGMNFRICEFTGSDMRVRLSRDMLRRALSYRDIIAMTNKQSDISNRSKSTAAPSNEFRKAIVIDDFENMDIATQEVWRLIKGLIADKKTIGTPIILTGNTSFFKKKRPMLTHSVFIPLRYRPHPEICMVVRQIANEMKVVIPDDEVGQLATDSAGDVRRVIKHLEYHRSDSSSAPRMETVEVRGPVHALWRVMDVSVPRTVDEVITDILIEGQVVPFGLQSSYLTYVPWVLRKMGRFSPGLNVSMIKEVAALFQMYGQLVDMERSGTVWGLQDVADVIAGWGTRTVILDALRVPKTHRASTGKAAGMWWTKPITDGEATPDTPCLTKTLNSSLYANQVQTLSLVATHSSDAGLATAWRPGSVRMMAELMSLRPTQKQTNAEKLVRLVCPEKN